MTMLMIGIMVAVRMRMAGPIRVHVLVFVEDDLQATSERIRDAAKSGETGNMIAALKARDHRFRHREPLRELLLRLAGMGAEFEQPVSTLGRKRGAVIDHGLSRWSAEWRHMSST